VHPELAADGDHQRRRETLKPGVSRLRPDHDIVRKEPYRFRPADPTDTATRSRLVKLTGTTIRTQRRGVLSVRAPVFPCQPLRLPRPSNPSRLLP
jgi:hypothetical protein